MEQTHIVWAFYLSNGSIERRYCTKNELRIEKQARKAYPFEKWHSKIKILKVVREKKEKKTEICPKNPYAHHLKPQWHYNFNMCPIVTEPKQKCDFCGEKLQ